MSGSEVDDLPYGEFVQYYAVSLDIDEQKVFERYVLAGNDPKKFKWSDGPKPTPSSKDIMGKMLEFARLPPNRRSQVRRVDIADIAEIQGDAQFAFQLPDGTFVDGQGQPVAMPEGYTFVKSEKASQGTSEDAKQSILDSFFGE